MQGSRDEQEKEKEKKIFLNEQSKDIEENNRMGKIRELVFSYRFLRKQVRWSGIPISLIISPVCCDPHS